MEVKIKDNETKPQDVVFTKLNLMNEVMNIGLDQIQMEKLTDVFVDEFFPKAV